MSRQWKVNAFRLTTDADNHAKLDSENRGQKSEVSQYLTNVSIVARGDGGSETVFPWLVREPTQTSGQIEHLTLERERWLAAYFLSVIGLLLRFTLCLSTFHRG